MKELERSGQVEIGDHAKRVLGHLAMAKGSFLFGIRHGTAPMTLIDNAATAENRVVAHSLRLIHRSTVGQLIAAGYLENDSSTSESINVRFRISEKGLAFCLLLAEKSGSLS